MIVKTDIKDFSSLYQSYTYKADFLKYIETYYNNMLETVLPSI